MPHLQFDYGGMLAPDELRAFADSVTDRYVEEMKTTADHVAVTIRTHDAAAVTIGRAVDGPTLVLQADVRGGRPFDRKRGFALSVIDLASDSLDVPEPNAKVVFTEHDGEDMHGANRVGGEWAASE